MNLSDSELPARAMILDRELIRVAYAHRTRHGHAPHDEVWAGTLVLYAPPDNEHQLVRSLILIALCEATEGIVLPGANVAADEARWQSDFRCPHVVTYLVNNPARNCNTHWAGGPDLAIDIVSPGEDPRLKLDFYAKVNTRELLVVDRDPWAIEMYRLQAGKLVLAGTSDLASSETLASQVLPLTFRLQPGTARPSILITHNATGQTWTA